MVRRYSVWPNLRIDTKGNWELITQYDGWPNGLKFHKDGRAFICDYKAGLLALDPKQERLKLFWVPCTAKISRA
jgi:sugar lactone lactonase YvrE